MTSITVELRTLLDQICKDRNATYSSTMAMHLKDQLDANKSTLIRLLDNTPKNNEHRTMIQSGKTIINSKEYRVNEDFIKEVLFLSDQLDMNEFEASRYLLEGISKASTLNSTSIDAAVYLYHEERGYVLTILIVVLETAKNNTLDSQMTDVFYSFMADIVSGSTCTTSFVQKLLKLEKELAGMISTLSKTGMLASAAAAKQQLNTQQQQQQQQQPTTSSLFQQPQQQQQQSVPAKEMEFARQTTALRIDKLTDERVYLVEILYHIGSLYLLDESDILAILTKAQSLNLSDATCPYIIVALLSAISVQSKKPSQQNFTTNTKYIKNIHQEITTKPWKVNIFKATVEVRWALTISELAATESSIEDALSMNRSNRVKFAESALALDVFGFMNDYLLYFKQNLTDAADKKNKIGAHDMDVDSGSSAMAIDGLIVDPNDYTKFVADISADFQHFVIQELEALTQSFIFNMSDIFSNLKRMTLEQEEDEATNGTNNEGVIYASSLQKFLTLMASIYRDRLNAGLKFWDPQPNGLSTFLPWLLEFKSTQDLAAIFDFVGAICTGEKCALLAHNSLKLGTAETDIFASHIFSWGKLFSALQFYGKQYTDRSTTEKEPPTMPLVEEITLCKFLYVCQQVVQYSVEARLNIWNNQVLKVHESVVTMISCPTSTRFRAALYNLLSAFCSNWGGGINHVGESISLQVWNTLEYSDMILPGKTMAIKAPDVASASTLPTAPPVADPRFISATPAQMLQAKEILNKATAQSDGTKTARDKPTYYLPEQPAGFMREYADEKSRRLYTETISVLKLFSSLIHTESRRDQLVSGFVPTASSIPVCLGHDNNRSPGTAPYISLIIDHILLNLKNQQYIYPETKWQLTDACLNIVENSILAFDIQPVCDYIYYSSKNEPEATISYSNLFQGNINASTTGSNTTHDLQQALLTCVSHPGFDILIRILSGGSLIQEMFKIVEKGKESFSSSCKTKTRKSMYFEHCMARCLRIFSSVFKIQNLFVNVLLPRLRQDSQVLPMGQFKLGAYTFPLPPSELRSLANHMLYNTQVIVQIALMVNCEDHEAICRLSTCVLGDLASAPEDHSIYVDFPNHVNVPIGGLGSRLAGILLSSQSANEIIFGVGERLEIDTAEITTYDDYEYDFNTIPFWLAEKTMSNIYRYDREEENYYRYTTSVRIGILDILLKSMGKNVPSPTIAEFLLGFDVKDSAMKGIQQDSIVTDKRARLACLLSILSMVKTGIDSDEDGQETQQEPLIQSHPVLAEKCYQLIYKLCVRESTSNGILQYLRGGDDFMLKQFQSISRPLQCCLSVSEPYFAGEMVTVDHTRVKTDYLTLVSVLNQRAWLMKLIALDLHQLAGTPLKSESTKLLNLMYNINSNDNISLVDKLESMKLGANSRGYQQPMWNLIEIINSLDFNWVDQLDTPQDAHKDTTFSYFKDFDARNYVIKKMDEYEIFDICKIYKTLRQYQLTNPVTKTLSDEDRAKMEFEMGDLLRQLMAQNRHREISYSRLHCLRAWKQVVEITISDCFESFTFEARERIIYDLLNVLLPKLESDTGLHENILKGLSEVILSLLTRLREDKRRQAILQVAPPMDTATTDSKLPVDNLRTVFAMIINCIRKEKSFQRVRSTMYSALVNLLHYITPDNGDHAKATTTKNNLPELFRAEIDHLLEDQNKGSLLNIICKDAREGLDDYKTTAYTALEAIYVLLNEESRSVMHTLLVKNLFLKYAIDVIESSNDALLHVIEDRDASLIPLNIHEAKISFFMQIALNKDGASLLLDNGILQSLDNCTFMKIRPENDRYRDNPNALKRYRRLLIPILELINVMLKDNINNFQAYDMLKFEEWVKPQDTLLHILKDQNKQTTLSALYVLQLTTSLVSQLGCQRDYFVGLENRGLDLVDSAVMNLITKYCLSRNWASVVVPTNEEEKKWATEKVPATVNNYEMESMLVAKADKYIIDIINNLLSYAEASTFRITKRQEGESFKPIFANTLDSIKDRAPNSLRKASSTTPSLTTLVACISFTGKKLNAVIAEVESLCFQKDDVGSLKYEEILEIAQTAIPKRLGIQYDSLNPTQQSQLLTTEITNRHKLKTKELNNLLFTIENAIYILWRHLEFYLRPESISTVQQSSPCERYVDETVVLLQQALFQTSNAVIAQLRESCQTVLEPVLQSLEKITFSIQNDTSLPQMYDRLRKCYN